MSLDNSSLRVRMSSYKRKPDVIGEVSRAKLGRPFGASRRQLARAKPTYPFHKEVDGVGDFPLHFAAGKVLQNHAPKRKARQPLQPARAMQINEQTCRYGSFQATGDNG